MSKRKPDHQHYCTVMIRVCRFWFWFIFCWVIVIFHCISVPPVMSYMHYMWSEPAQSPVYVLLPFRWFRKISGFSQTLFVFFLPAIILIYILMNTNTLCSVISVVNRQAATPPAPHSCSELRAEPHSEAINCNTLQLRTPLRRPHKAS